MWRVVGMFFFLIFTDNGWASTANCNVQIRNIYDALLPSVSSTDHITAGLSGNTTEYRILYTWNYSVGPGGRFECSAPSGIPYRLVMYVMSENEAPTYVNGEWIFPTKVKGIGISFFETKWRNQTIGTIENPVIEENNQTDPSYSVGTNMAFRVRLWKIPGVVGAADDNGLFNIEGFKVIHALQFVNATDSFASLPPDQSDYPMPNSYTINAATISGSVTFVPGTCNFINKTVEMGTHTLSDFCPGFMGGHS